MRRAHALALAAALLAAPGARAAGPPPLQPIETESSWRLKDFPRPAGVALTELEMAPDFHHVVLGVKDGSQQQIAVAGRDGSGYRCLTCGLVSGANKQVLLDDGRRMWFANTDSQGRDQTEVVPGVRAPLPGAGGTGDFQWYVLECAPSLYDCRDRRVDDVQFPIDSLAEGAQNREASLDPTGTWVAWNEVRSREGTRMTIARLEREGDGSYRLAGPRVFNPPYDLGGDVTRWAPGSRFYEGASWWAGDRVLKYQSTSSALNYDTFALDTRTGARQQVTTDLDYNEIGDHRPDGRWFAGSSARGLDRMDLFTQLERPPFIDMVAFGQVGRVSLWNNRRCMNERWLWDRAYGQRRGGYSGQPVTFTADWTVRQFQWFPDGVHALAREELIPNHPEPADAEERARYRIVRLPGLEPLAPAKSVAPSAAQVARWSVPAADYQGMAARQVPGQVVPGPRGGTATLLYTGTFLAGHWEVRYDGWSDDGRSFLDGTESLTTPNPIVLATWRADLTLRGAHTGHLRATVHVGPQNTYEGDVDSELDGRRYDSIPTQADCPGIRQAPLRLEDVRVQGDRVTGAVRAVIPEDAEHRPVHLATVTAGGRATRTDERGRFALTVPERPAGLRATAATFVPAQATITQTG